MMKSGFWAHPLVFFLGTIVFVVGLYSRLLPASPELASGSSSQSAAWFKPTASTNHCQRSSGSSASGSQSPEVRESSDFDIALGFELPPFRRVSNLVQQLRRQPQICSHSNYDLDALFIGGSDSLVAKAVGGAEGTRTPNGGYTSAYQGHTDPGNGVWNLGTFSYQHGAASPEAADRKQLRRLRDQVRFIQQRAQRVGLTLDLTEVLNGIDLANQSPLAALGEPGYAEWLAAAKQRGLQGEDAILWARVKGYWDVDRGRWNAPGLGNTEPLIRRDQARRMNAIAEAIAAHPVPEAPAIASENSSDPISSDPTSSDPTLRDSTDKTTSDNIGLTF